MQMIVCVFVFVVSATVANAVLYNGFLGQRSGLSNTERKSDDSTWYYDPKSAEPIDEAASFVQLGSSKKETTDHTWYYDPKEPPMPIAEASSFIQVGSAMYNTATLQRTDLTLELKLEQSKAERKFREMSEDEKKELERKSLARALTARKKYDEAMSSLQVVKMQDHSQVLPAPRRKAPSAMSLIQSSKVEKSKLALDKLQNAAESEGTRANAWRDHLAQWMTQDASSQVEEAKLALYLKNAAESEADKERVNAWSHHLSNWMTQGATSKAARDWSHHLSNWMAQDTTNKASEEGKATVLATNEATTWILSQDAASQAAKEDNADWRHGDEDQWHGMMSRMMGRMVKSDVPDSFVQVSSEHEASAPANVDMLAKAKIVEALYGVDKYSENVAMPIAHDRIRVAANGHMNNGFVDL